MNDLQEIPKRDILDYIRAYAHKFNGSMTGDVFRDAIQEIERLRHQLSRAEENADTAETRYRGMVHYSHMLRQQIAELQNVRDSCICLLPSEVDGLHKEIAELREVLEWYASDEAYAVPHIGCSALVMADRGARARTNLDRYRDTQPCKTCHGVGEVTRISGSRPEDYSEENVPCPDCYKDAQPADAE